jgi:hypothetical protein
MGELYRELSILSLQLLCKSKFKVLFKLFLGCITYFLGLTYSTNIFSWSLLTFRLCMAAIKTKPNQEHSFVWQNARKVQSNICFIFECSDYIWLLFNIYFVLQFNNKEIKKSSTHYQFHEFKTVPGVKFKYIL